MVSVIFQEAATGTISHMLHGAGIFAYIYPRNGPNVGKYTIHGAYGFDVVF